MSTNLTRLTSLPDALMVLADVARSDGYFMLDRLIERFKSGSNKFDSQGEALFGVERSSVLVGVGGLNIDPYFKDPNIGRVRHLYIHPDARRTGVGRMITRAIEDHAKGHFSRLQLFTPEKAAGAFYVSLGYEAVAGVHKVSHAKSLSVIHGRKVGASSMKCPLCNHSLETREVAPCFDCGHAPCELEELRLGEHEYHVFSIYGQELVLCDFCDADFGSYYPEHLGLPVGQPQEYPLELVSKVTDPKPGHDGYCEKCQHRWAFLVFLKKVREYNSP